MKRKKHEVVPEVEKEDDQVIDEIGVIEISSKKSKTKGKKNRDQGDLELEVEDQALAEAETVESEVVNKKLHKKKRKHEEEDEFRDEPEEQGVVTLTLDTLEIISRPKLLRGVTDLLSSHTHPNSLKEQEIRIIEAAIPLLMKMYGATMSPKDQKIFDIFARCSSQDFGITIESMPLFGPKCVEAPSSSGASNPLFAHSTRANTILGSLDDTKAYYTSLLYDPQKPGTSSSTYDMRFLLPVVCHVLDEKNICDGGKVVANGWIYLIVRGMGVEDDTLRAEAFLAFQRLVQNFQQAKAFRNQDVKLWLHFLNGVKRGIVQMGECKISNLLSTWMVATWAVLRQPSHPMFQRVTKSLFAKPTIEMTILPDFIPFYNDGEDKESRIWILNVLYQGLKTKEDWKISQKLPTIKYLCSSFIFEKVKTQKSIVGILIHASKIPGVAEEMTDKYSIPLWLSNLSTTSKTLKIDLEFFFQTLVTHCPQNNMRSKIFEFVGRKQNWSLSQTVSRAKVEDDEDEEKMDTAEPE